MPQASVTTTNTWIPAFAGKADQRWAFSPTFTVSDS
jgi:hypothetical protein